MNKMNGKLFLIATPIGNLGDITYRAVETLKNVDIIAAEDTRHSLKLLNYLEISKPMISYHRHNEDTKTTELINILKSGKNIGLITDAGTPGISDPGEEIVKQAIKENIEIVPIPGACALINALIASGLNTREFAFYGFLPLDKKLRKEKFDDIRKQNKTIIFYEAPHRLIKTLQEIEKEYGNIQVVVAKELTKIHEQYIRDYIANIIENIVPDFVSVAELKYILTSLIKEKVSVKDIVYIFEKINDFADEETKEDLLSRVRHSLSRQISKSVANENNLIQAFELSSESLKYMQAKVSGKNTVIRIDNSKMKVVVNNIYNFVEKQALDMNEIVVVVPMEIRQVMSVVLSQLIPNVKVIAREEIACGYNLEILDKV